MRLTDHIELIGSGRMGFELTDGFDCHVYLVHDDDDAVLIDAGAGCNIRPILEQIDCAGVPRNRIRRLLLTHAHPDHAGGAAALRDALGFEVLASPHVASALRAGDVTATGFDRLVGPGGYPEGYRLVPCQVDGELRAGDRVAVGSLSLEVIETPGHCAGHLSFALHRPDGVDLFSGDALFARGRILLQNLPDCSVSASCDSIRQLTGLRPDGLFPGHGSISIQRGWMHIYSAMASIESSVPPPQLM